MKDDMISRAAALKGLEDLNIASFYEENEHSKEAYTEVKAMLKSLPSAQPEPITINIDHELTQDEYEKLRKDMANAPIMLLPSAQQWTSWESGEPPKESGWYIVTAYDGSGSRVTFAKYQKRLKRWELTGARAYWRVLAWQPLPKPWEGKEDER